MMTMGRKNCCVSNFIQDGKSRSSKSRTPNNTTMIPNFCLEFIISPLNLNISHFIQLCYNSQEVNLCLKNG